MYTRIVDLLHTGNMVFDADVAGNHRYQEEMFQNDQALFWTELVNWSMELRSMDNDFGILPIPKSDSSQEDYRSYVFVPNVICVPSTQPDINRTGVILEALCAEGYRTVIPAYYDKMLKNKISRDDDSGDMLDIIFTHRNYDLAYVYWATDIGDQFVNYAKKNETSLATWVAKSTSKIETKMQKTLAKYLDN